MGSTGWKVRIVIEQPARITRRKMPPIQRLMRGLLAR